MILVEILHYLIYILKLYCFLISLLMLLYLLNNCLYTGSDTRIMTQKGNEPVNLSPRILKPSLSTPSVYSKPRFHIGPIDLEKDANNQAQIISALQIANAKMAGKVWHHSVPRIKRSPRPQIRNFSIPNTRQKALRRSATHVELQSKNKLAEFSIENELSHKQSKLHLPDTSRLMKVLH